MNVISRYALTLASGATALVSTLALAAEHGTKDEAVAMVNAGLAHIKEVGRDQAYADFMKPGSKWIAKDLYLFCHKASGNEIINVAHGVKPSLVGKNIADMKSPDGKLVIQELWSVAKSKPAGGWVDYNWPNPVSKTIEKKTSFVRRVADTDTFCGVGIYRE